MIQYIDCVEGLRGMIERNETADMCLTDPPFNRRFRGTVQKMDGELYYADNMPPDMYMRWCMLWFGLLQKVCRGIVIFCGKSNMNMWMRNTDPVGFISWYKPNSQGRDTFVYMSKFEPVLFYGKFNSRIPVDVIKVNVKMGKDRELPGGIHPCPGNLTVYTKLLQQLKPKSVIDPFFGSGTTGEACLNLGIPFIGFEKEASYKDDWEIRLKRIEDRKFKNPIKTFGI